MSDNKKKDNLKTLEELEASVTGQVMALAESHVQALYIIIGYETYKVVLKLCNQIGKKEVTHCNSLPLVLDPAVDNRLTVVGHPELTLKYTGKI
jgi:hypothetical protein